MYFWLPYYWFVILGHLAIWVAAFNQLHATSAPSLIRKLSYPFVLLGIIGTPFLFSMISGVRRWGDLVPASFQELPTTWRLVSAIYLVAGILMLLIWCARRWNEFSPPRLLLNQTSESHDFAGVVVSEEKSGVEKVFSRIPFNQIYQCQVERREVELQRGAAELDGITLTHLSDFHFTGNVHPNFFRKVIELSNELRSDLVAITGDIIDSPKCWHWLEEILSQLKARHGVYFVLGNHDRKTKDVARVRSTLSGFGFNDVSQGWNSIRIGNRSIHLIGNESPWFPAPRDTALPTGYSDGDLQIALTHSPDQWSWARRLGVELTLAGHTHGGQIRFPLIGPIISPSHHGVKYASGFFAREGASMIVSRGVSGEEPIRWNCPPEVGQITFRKSANELNSRNGQDRS